MKTIFYCLAAFYTSSAIAQTIITLQPGPTEGKDAKVWSIEPDGNFGSDIELKANAWTWDGTSGTERSFLQFDLSQIPEQAQLCWAKLSLYGTAETSGQTNSQLSGSNESYLRRVIDPWNEATVSWNTQPGSTTLNEVSIPVSTADYEDNVDMDVTALVNDMLSIPSENYGFVFELANEVHYRRRVFASSDAADPTHYPKLEICYSGGVPIENTHLEKDLTIHPNPVHEQFSVVLQNRQPGWINIRIIALNGAIIYETNQWHDGINATISFNEAVTSKIIGCAMLSITAGDQIGHAMIIKN